MPKIVPIVEGTGEVPAIPCLLRKIFADKGIYDIQIAKPKNAHGRGNLTKQGGLERFVQYAWKEEDCGAVLIVMDAEQECPVEIAKDFSDRLQAMGIAFPVCIVIANCMYENWLIASIQSIQGNIDLPMGIQPVEDPDSIGNAKAWINNLYPRDRAYKETQDQVSMTSLLDLNLAAQSRSFRRMLKAIDEMIEAINAGDLIVSPIIP